MEHNFTTGAAAAVPSHTHPGPFRLGAVRVAGGRSGQRQPQPHALGCRRLPPAHVLVSLRAPPPCMCADTSENYASDYLVSLYIQKYLETLLFEHGVDLVLAGHYHSYERCADIRSGRPCHTSCSTCPVYQQQCNSAGPVNVVLGMGGAGLDDETYMDKPWCPSRMCARD